MTHPKDVSNFIGEISQSTSISPNGFLKPFHLVILGIELKRAPKELELLGELATYAHNAGLYKIIDPYQQTYNYGTNNGFHPVVPLTNIDEVYKVTQHLSNLVNKSIDATSQDSLTYALLELLNNCFNHGSVKNNDLNGLICAQTWPRGNLGQIAIADPGIGIRKSLLENPCLSNNLINSNACELATQYGVTSKPDQHSGYGLALAHDLMKQVNGNLIIYSGNEYFSIRNNGGKKKLLAEPWKGAIIILEWRLNKTLDVKSVYDAWPLPEGVTTDDFNF
ncbi:MAG: ATP-binding protein [Gammaproteobacteria bacterium]|jgi:anti-sigma regulatory factor (Ser/Thr protein kinase)